PLFKKMTNMKTQPNVLAVRIQPDEGISLRFDSKVPGPNVRSAPVGTAYRYATSFAAEPPEPYERRLLGPMRGHPTQSARRGDVTAIEKSLSDLWRGEKKEGDHAVTRAALWNVVAHTSTSEHHALASETLCRAAATVPQRTIVVRANPNAEPDLASWISANC